MDERFIAGTGSQPVQVLDPFLNAELNPECGVDLQAHIQPLIDVGIDDGYLKQDTERTIQLKGCDYAWGYANLGVHFTAGSNVKVAGLGEGVTKIISASSLSSTKISDLGYDVSSNFEATSSNRCGALKAGSRANFGPAWDKFFYAPPGNDGPETTTRVTFEDLTVTGFVNEDRIINIGDGFFRFARVTFDTNLGRLLFYMAYTPSWGEFYDRNKLEFDQVTFVRNTGTFMLLHKQTTMDHWHFKDCVYQENTYCGRGSDGRSGPASTVPNKRGLGPDYFPFVLHE